MKNLPSLILVVFLVIVFFCFRLYQFRDKIYITPKQELEKIDTFKLNQQYVYNKLLEYDIKYPEIVLKQIILETGHFKSKVCLKDTNLFGLYNNYRYLHFSTYEESIECYKKLQKKYKGGDYYEFLRKLPYAMDTLYISKLKKIKINVQGSN